MKFTIEHERVWLESLPTCCNDKPNLLLVSGNGQHVQVPAPLLLAVSPLVRSILTDLLPPAYSPCIISLPGATGDTLLVFADILTKGIVAAGNSKRVDELKQVLGMLGIEASLVSYQSEEIDMGHSFEVGEGEDSTPELSVTETDSGFDYDVSSGSDISEVFYDATENETDSVLDYDVSSVSDSSEDFYDATSSSSESSEVLGIVNEHENSEGFGIILKPCSVRVERYLSSSSLATQEGRCEEEAFQIAHQGDVRVRDDALDGTEGMMEEGSIQDCEKDNVKDKQKKNVRTCPKCRLMFKDKRRSHEGLNRHVLSHYYQVFFDVLPRCKPFPCPICGKFNRDRFTLVRHYAFTHKMVYELTDLTPEDLPGIPGRGSAASLSKPRLLKENLLMNIIIGLPVEAIATDCVSEEQEENSNNRDQTTGVLLSEQEMNLDNHEESAADMDKDNKGFSDTSLPVSELEGLALTRCRAIDH